MGCGDRRGATGQDLDNPWHRRLTDLAGLIREITAECAPAEFLDLGLAFARELQARPGSEYAPRNPFRVLNDALTLRTDEQIDAKSAERGLHLTLDGIHLNSAGARLVADELAAAIQASASQAQA